MTREALLRQSIKEFEDKEDNALFWTCRRIYTDSGYCYILKQESKPICCALHYNKSFETSEEIGRYENIVVSMNTREDLGFEGLIEYKGFVVALSSQGSYNETMKQWHYQGVGTFDPISNEFLIVDEEEVKNNLGVNSMPIMLRLQRNYPFVPSYFEAKSTKKYIMVDVDPGADLNGAVRVNVDKKLSIHQSDNVKLTFVNFTRDECLTELKRIQDESLKPDTQFGLLTLPSLENKYTYQLAFNWKSLTYISEFAINYYSKTLDEVEVNKIKEVLFESLEAL